MIATVILALAPLLSLDTVKPGLIQPFKTLEACLIAADKLNREDADLRLPEAREAGFEYVCIKFVQAGI